MTQPKPRRWPSRPRRGKIDALDLAPFRPPAPCHTTNTNNTPVHRPNLNPKETDMSMTTNGNTAHSPIITTDEYFGGCPTCGKNNGYINIGRDHWFLCREHHVMWCAGSNLFSSWRDQTEAEQEEAYKGCEDFEVVKPIYPPPPIYPPLPAADDTGPDPDQLNIPF